ncbi:hypothetical protein CLV83_4153 [Marinobacterium mangrovicola]|uniref:Uncharacterized protein n=2 Tax=Marinobacterium mangrovicola TaxID=1476959 RepID=A0A4R1G5X9_9GAMM|nr:hypothetical protein CLV83_4153 [Marinobacterium mangrovicola]
MDLWGLALENTASRVWHAFCLPGWYSINQWSFSMLRYLVVVMGVLFAPLSVQAEPVEMEAAENDCVKVGDMKYEMEDTQFGGSELAWEAQLENGCATPFDMVLKLHLQDESGETLYSSRVVETVNAGESLSTSKRLVVPTRVLESFAGVELESEERERPL